MRVPDGKPWVASVTFHVEPTTTGDLTSSTPVAAIIDLDATEAVDEHDTINAEEVEDLDRDYAHSAAADDAEDSDRKTHIEKEGFDGDRVLANEVLFLQDHGWWTEAAYAVPEGDVGQLYEILKVSCHDHIYSVLNFELTLMFHIDLDFLIHRNIKSKLLRLYA